MDPTTTLKEVLDLKERLLTMNLSTRERLTLGLELATKLRDVETWCRSGGYQPTWPQRRLTHDETFQLELAGHRPRG